MNAKNKGYIGNPTRNLKGRDEEKKKEEEN
jgi:hypothetical protein